MATSSLSPQMVTTLSAIATVQCVAEAYQDYHVLPDLRNVMTIAQDSEGLVKVHRHHLGHTIAWGEELLLEAAAIHATTTHPTARTVLYVMMSRLGTSLDELRKIKEERFSDQQT